MQKINQGNPFKVTSVKRYLYATLLVREKGDERWKWGEVGGGAAGTRGLVFQITLHEMTQLHSLSCQPGPSCSKSG